MARARREEDPETLHVVDGIGERSDLPLLRAVRAAVEVADVDRAPEAPHPPGEVASEAREVARSSPLVRHDEQVPSMRGHFEVGVECEDVRAKRHAAAAA